ncbi:MAG: thioredoxin family protein [Bacteroidetes bacterium]|nr:MAG: thioredoxin family protein [Bacteroidota bacterium]
MITRLILSLICSVIFSIGFAKDRSFPFFHGTLEEAQLLARELNKPYFIYFHSTHFAEACEQMKQSWEEPELIFFTDRFYLAVSLDVSLHTSELVERYEFDSFPAFLFFDPQGSLMGVHEGYLSGQDMLHTLENLFYQLGDPLRSMYVHRQAPQPLPPYYAMQLRGGGREPAQQKDALIRDIGTKELASHLPRAIIKTRVPGFEAYSPDLLISRDGPAFARYGLLIHQYVSTEELTVAIRRFERLWKGDIWVYGHYVANQWLYGLVLGTYQDEEVARTYADGIEKFEKKRPEILNLSTIFE